MTKFKHILVFILASLYILTAYLIFKPAVFDHYKTFFIDKKFKYWTNDIEKYFLTKHKNCQFKSNFNECRFILSRSWSEFPENGDILLNGDAGSIFFYANENLRNCYLVFELAAVRLFGDSYVRYRVFLNQEKILNSQVTSKHQSIRLPLTNLLNNLGLNELKIHTDNAKNFNEQNFLIKDDRLLSLRLKGYRLDCN